MNALRRRRMRALTCGLAAALALGGAELIIRAVGFRPYVELFVPTVDAALWVRDARLGWRNRASCVFENQLAGSVVRTGARGERLGLRASDDPARPAVLFVGDSTTFCAEVDDDRTGPSEVARRLPPTPDVAVINAGVRGYGTLQSRRMAAEWLERVPVRVVVYTYCDNDFVENLVPTCNAPALAPVARVASDGTCTTTEVPISYGPPWGVAVGDDPPPPEPALGRDLLRALEARSALVTAVRDRVARPPVRAGIDRWQRAIAWADEHGARAVLTRLLGDLRADCDARGARLLVTRFATAAPRRGSMAVCDTQDRLEAACAAAGVTFVDLRGAFTLDEDRYVTHLRTGRRDAHYGPLGTATYGATLAPHVARALEGGR